MKKTLVPLALAAMAGCMCCRDDRCDSPFGNWSVKLPYERMSAGSIILSRDADGIPRSLTLWRWAHPLDCSDVRVEGNRFSFRHPAGQAFEGVVQGDRMFGRIAPYDGKTGELRGSWQPFTGWRNAEIPEGVRTADARLGEPIDLLKDGLAGWETMDEKAKFGWSFKDGILSNRLGLKPDGSWAGGGANLRTKRADFYDFNIEYDVRMPAKSNSGVYLRGRFEIQTVDSYGEPLSYLNMAAYYGRAVPKVAAEKPAGEWQHVSATLYRRHLTVVLNGVTIIENEPVVGVTGGAIDADLHAAGPIYLQGDHSDADYRNMIVRPAL